MIIGYNNKKYILKDNYKMENKKEIFATGNYKYISKLVEEKIPVLKKNSDFKQKYTKLADLIDEMAKNLPSDYKKQFDEIIKLTYSVEEFYFALAYSLGIKYGEDLEKI